MTVTPWATVWDDLEEPSRREPPWGDRPNGGRNWCADCPGESKPACCAHKPTRSAVFATRADAAAAPEPAVAVSRPSRLRRIVSVLRRITHRKERP